MVSGWQPGQAVLIILAGGWGTRLGQQTEDFPKPMVPIGNRPVLWHIMNIYSAAGFNDFIISNIHLLIDFDSHFTT